ncbi:hypothetical protein NMY22_g11996 [Coprinellus aureogranulatus]|nr:hypothetical protein NMY22_g11996 [Coprinellus aureogranulatus]
MEMREEQEDDEGDEEGAGDLPYKLWNALKNLGPLLEVSMVAAAEYISAAHESIASTAWGPLPVLSNHDEQDSRSASPTPVPDLSEELQELNLKRDILDEQRKDFLQTYGYLGPRAFRGPQFEAYLKKRGVLNKAFRFIREALTPPGDPLPGSLRRENAVTRAAFFNGDARPRKDGFDSDEETVV